MAQPLIDFAELPEKSARGESLELFARELLRQLGFSVTWSGRGPDEGKDLLAIETICSAVSDMKRTWLVSCKDHFRSGESVKPDHIGSITDRCTQHKAEGFLLITTTVPSSGLAKIMDGINQGTNGLRAESWDHVRLEELLCRPEMMQILKRYFPESFKRIEQLRPAEVLLSKLESEGISQTGMARIRSVVAEELIRAKKKLPRATDVYPQAVEFHPQIDQAIKSLLIDNDSTMCARTLSVLPQAEWGATVAALVDEDADRAHDLLIKSLELNGGEVQTLNAVQVLIDSYCAPLKSVLCFLDRLKKRDIELILEQYRLAEKIGDQLRDHLQNEPHPSLEIGG